MKNRLGYKKRSHLLLDKTFGGRGGIRTPGTLPHAGFQDQCIKPALPLFRGNIACFAIANVMYTL